MTCIDSSVLIGFLRADDPNLLHTFAKLARPGRIIVPRPVVAEVLSGTSAQSFPLLSSRLSAFPQPAPTTAVWDVIEQWTLKAIRSGQHFQLTDLLIAATASEIGLPIWSLDNDFTRMEKLGFCKLYKPES